MILSGVIESAAIDSTVLEWLQGRRADSEHELRVIETIGPSPIPPWVISQKIAGQFPFRDAPSVAQICT